MLPARDFEGAVRYLNVANVPLPRELKDFNQGKIEHRAKMEKRKASFQMVIDDVYAMVKVLSMQDDLKIVKVKDYIKNPKPNGYRSLHVIVKVPVYFLDRKQYVPVEIQFRTVAMDFWASLEHTLKYKQDVQLEGIDMFDELKNCSEIIEDVERRMQILMHAVQTTDVEEAARKRREQLEEQEARVAKAQPSFQVVEASR